MPERISAEDVVHRRENGEDLMLVCAYEDENKCKDADVQGSLTFREFQFRRSTLPKDAGIIFFCA